MGAVGRRDETGATPLDWVMVAALVVAAIVLVASLGASWFGDGV
jgi:hypothetical protein